MLQFFLEDGKGLIETDYVFDAAKNSLQALNNRIGRLTKYMSGLSDLQIGLAVGAVYQNSHTTSVAIQNAWGKSLIPDRPTRVTDDIRELGEEMYYQSYSLLSFCGNVVEIPPYGWSNSNGPAARQTPVPKGQRRELARKLNEISKESEAMAKVLGVKLYIND